MSLVRNIAIIAAILILLILGIRQQLEINDLNSEISTLEKQLAEISFQNEKAENELKAPDEDQMQKYARESGYKDPDAKYFYNDFAG